MSDIKQELDEIQQLIYQGCYPEVIENVGKILVNENISKEERTRAKIILSWAEFWSGYFRIHIDSQDKKQLEKALSIFQEAAEESSQLSNPSLLFDSYIGLYSCHVQLYMYEELKITFEELKKIYKKIEQEEPEIQKQKEPIFTIFKAFFPKMYAYEGEITSEDYVGDGLKLAKRALRLSEGAEDEFFVAFACLNYLLGYYIDVGDIEKEYEIIEKHLQISEEFSNKYALAHTYGYFSRYYNRIGDQNKNLEFLMKRLKIWEELDLEGAQAAHNSYMGDFYFSQGNRDKSLEHYEKSLKYFKERKSVIKTSWILRSIGSVYRNLGDLNQALKYTEESYAILINKKPEGWWEILLDLSEIYLLKGNLNKALEYQEERLAFYENMERKLSIAYTLLDISRILWQRGMRQQALEKSLQSLKLFEDMGNKLWIGYTLVELIFYSTELDEIEQANQYFEQLNEISFEIKDRSFTQRFNFSEALVLRKNPDLRDKLKAEVLLENLLREDLNYNHHVSVLLTLSEILLLELKSTGNRNIYHKLQNYVLDLYNLAITNNSYLLSTETLILQSKLALVELDIEKAESLLEQAYKIADEKGLERLKETINHEKENFKEEKEKIREFDKKDSIHKKMDLINFDKRMNGVKKASISVKQSDKQIIQKSLLKISI